MATKNPFSLLDSDSETEQKPNTKPTTTKKNTVPKKTAPKQQNKVQPNRNRGGPVAAYEAGAKEHRKPRSGRDTHGHRNPEHQMRKGKRDFERRSGTGRGKEIKKDGAGSRNWGQPGDEVAAKEDGEAEDAADAEAEVPEEPEAPELTLEDFEAMRAEKRTGEAFVALEKKTATDEIDGLAYSKKSSEDAANDTFLMMGGKKDKRSRERKQEKARVVDVNFKVQSSTAPQWEERPSRGRGGRGRGRGRGRGGRGGRNSNGPRPSGAPVNTMDASAFPALGGN